MKNPQVAALLAALALAAAAAGAAAAADQGAIGVLHPGPPDPRLGTRPAPRMPVGPGGGGGERTLEASEDAFVASSRPGENFGGDERLLVGDRSGFGATRSFVYWDLEDLEPDEVVLDGEIKLYMRGGPGGDPSRDIVIRRVTGAWTEGSVTWDRQPASDDDRQETRSLGPESGWHSFDVGRLARRWWSGEWDNQGVYIQGYEADGAYREFGSRESDREPELRLDVAIDDVPPVSTMKPLPPYTNSSSFGLEWEGEDPDPATGIDYFRVWGRRDEEPWLLIEPNTKAMAGVFTGAQDGHRYSFRVTAVDVAGNEEVSTGDAQATTVVDLTAPVSAVNPLPPFVPGPFEVSWSGRDEPGTAPGVGPLASGILHYDVQYNIGGGAWGDLALGVRASRLTFDQAVQGARYQFRVRAVDQAGNIQPFGAALAETQVDGLAPVVWFLATSGVDRPTFPVRWAQTDPGGSGTAGIDVQYRVASGPWLDWITDSTASSRDFSGELGKTYGFRGRGRDRAGNEGAYPPRAQLEVHAIASATLTERAYIPTVFGSTDPGRPPR
ncbi:MAG: DNRLRE domain-containing protein [Anaerolineae bacterium]